MGGGGELIFSGGLHISPFNLLPYTSQKIRKPANNYQGRGKKILQKRKSLANRKELWNDMK